MNPNVGDIDRWIRIVLGAGAMAVALAAASGWSVAGLFVMATGIVRRCPLYRVLGVDTNRKAPAQ